MDVPRQLILAAQLCTLTILDLKSTELVMFWRDPTDEFIFTNVQLTIIFCYSQIMSLARANAFKYRIRVTSEFFLAYIFPT